MRICSEEISHVHMEKRVLVKKLLVSDSFLRSREGSFYKKVCDLDEVTFIDKIRDIIASVS